MATKPFNSAELNKLISERDRLQRDLSISPTAYDYAGGRGPTESDLAKDVTLAAVNKQIERLKGQQISERWYGKGQDEDTGTGKENQGLFSKTIDVINRPLMGVVGAIQGLTGTGKKEGILENIDYNVQTGKQMFGDVFKQAGLPGIVAAPMGFAADIAFDPLNWLTMGTTALLPRTAAGFIKGAKAGGIAKGAKAAAAGATSRLGQIAMNIADWIPAVTKEDGKYVLSSLGKTKTAEELGEKIFKQAVKYNELTGIDPMKNMGRGILGLTHIDEGKGIFKKPSEYIEGGIKKVLGEEKGGKLIKAFKYSPMEKSKEARLFDEIMNNADINMRAKGAAALSDAERYDIIKAMEKAPGAGEDVRAALDQWKADLLDPYARPSAKKKLMASIEKSLAESGVAAESRGARVLAGDDALTEGIAEAGAEAEKLTNEATMLARLKNPTGWESFDIAGYKLSDKIKGGLKGKGQFRTDLIEEGKKLKEAKKPVSMMNDLEKAAVSEADAYDAFVRESISSGKITAKQAADADFMKDLTKTKSTYGEQVLEYYDFLGKLFKFGKVGASPSAILNAYVGNPMMYFAAGGDLSAAYMGSLKNAYDLVNNKATPAMIYKNILSNENFLKNALKYDTYIRSTYGTGVADLTANLIDNAAVAEGKAAGLLMASDNPEALIIEVRKLKNVIDRALDHAKKGKAELAKIKVGVPSEAMESLIKEIQKSEGSFKFAPKVQNFLQAEVYGDLDKFDAVRKWVADQAKAGNKAAQALDLVTNKLARRFEQADQISKLGTAMHLSGHGLSAGELRVMSPMFGIRESDIVDKVVKGGQEFYKIDFAKATDMVNEIFMNYAAMPTAVKVMRSVPLLNSPFISFSYAMLPKFGKALIHNPAAFNKMNFAMKEFENLGTKSPLERKALESKYYDWYNSPGMVRIPDLPFFQENPIYLNIASMNPFYSMSIGGETKKKYKDETLEQVSATLDKLGLFQNPVAQTIKDYLILPALMARGETPQGSFGQVLYPRDASATERFGYATRSIVDAYTPNVFSMVGGSALGAGQKLLPQSLQDLDLIKYMPGYQGRNIAYSMQGKSSIGVPSKEDPFRKTARAISSGMGLPVHPMDLTYLSSEVKKKIKK